ncbi:hypothetical protein Tco_0479628 [Tanacetum coccineum]
MLSPSPPHPRFHNSGIPLEIETVDECVDEIDKLAELNGEMQLKQEDHGCVHASNELQLHVVHVVAGEHEVD